MSIQSLCVTGFRSIKHVYIPLQRINVIVGPNDLLPALATLIVEASAHTQLWITTHSTRLADAIRAESGCIPILLEKFEGETRVQGQSDLERSTSI